VCVCVCVLVWVCVFACSSVCVLRGFFVRGYAPCACSLVWVVAMYIVCWSSLCGVCCSFFGVI